MRSILPIVGAILTAAIVVLGVAAVSSGSATPNGSPLTTHPANPPEFTPSPEKPGMREIATEAPSQFSGQGPGIAINGNWIPLPPEATITTVFVNYAPGAPVDEDLPISVNLGSSEIVFRPSGVLIDSRVQPEHAGALQALLDALRSE